MQSVELKFRVSVTSELPNNLGHIPLSPAIDFNALVAKSGVPGVFDPNSLAIFDLASGEQVEFARSEDFAYTDRGRIEWVIADPSHRKYEIRFRTAATRPALEPQTRAPLVGVGDLLRYNAGEAHPIVLAHSMKLVDLTGDGRPDLAGCWNYYHRPGSPISGVVCYPRVGREEEFVFGDMARLRFVEQPADTELHHFPGVYTEVDFADWNGDGHMDLVFVERGKRAATFFLNTGKRDGGGWPIFVKDASLELPFDFAAGLRAVDLDGDGRLDLVANGQFIRTANPRGWPFAPEQPVDLGAGNRVDFIDLDGNGHLDLVFVEEVPFVEGVRGDPSRFCSGPKWRRRTDPEKPAFGPPQDLQGIDEVEISLVSAVDDNGRQGLLVPCDAYQRLVFHELVSGSGQEPQFARRGEAGSVGAVLALSDQAWPCVCDWNADGAWDMVIGGGYGWPRVLLNQGTDARPALARAARILAAGEPIRVLRDQLLDSRHWHNMGYPYPAFVDWDGDGLPDLMLPNETNRIVWYKNTGTREEPHFDERRFLEVDGYPDSAEKRAASGKLGEDSSLPNHPYPRDENSPFFWRTGAAFADWNGDGLMDFITHSNDRQATLFAQYLDENGERRLSIAGPVRLEDGRCVDDSIVGRQKHWTESFRPVDWDGDGLIDLVYSLAGTGEIYLLRNVGTPEEPVFAPPRQFKCYGEPISFTIHGPNAWAADLNGDGKPDLLGCVEWSVYPFYAHAALEMEEHPRYEIGDPSRSNCR